MILRKFYSPGPVLRIQCVKIYQVWSVSVYESTECKTIPPAGGHVSDLHPLVPLQPPPAPLLQRRHPHHVCGSRGVVCVCGEARVVLVSLQHHSLASTPPGAPQLAWQGFQIIYLSDLLNDIKFSKILHDNYEVSKDSVKDVYPILGKVVPTTHPFVRHILSTGEYPLPLQG